MGIFFNKLKNVKKENKVEFNYDKFASELNTELEEFVKALAEKQEDVYIISINYCPDFTTTIGVVANSYTYLNEITSVDDNNYFYYKYCEEEWEKVKGFDSLSAELQRYYSELEQKYNSDYEKFEESYKEHSEMIIQMCKSILKNFQETTTYKSFPDLLLNVYVREYFDNEECIRIFEEVNAGKEIAEYAKYING